MAYKFKRALLLNSMARLRIIRSIGFPGIPTRIKFGLKEAEMHMELFVLQLIKGGETRIPHLLDISYLPVSYRFYDCVLRKAKTMAAELR